MSAKNIYETTSFILRLKECDQDQYVRSVIIPKTLPYAVGTIEIGSGDSEILRIDIAADYEKEKYIEELIRPLFCI